MDSKEKLFHRVAEKVKAQDNTATFFDLFLHRCFKTQQGLTPPLVELFNQLFDSKENRFQSYQKRSRESCPVGGDKRTVHTLDMALSQGSHSVIKWRGHGVYKSTFDMVIYTMLIDELEPDVIIELGSGLGGSAVWMADTARGRGLDTQIYSYDINKPDIEHPHVTFCEYDLNSISKKKPLPHQDKFFGKKLIIEDAHVNVENVLLNLDKLVEPGDYLIVEDSDAKQPDIAQLIQRTQHNYEADCYYLDFFGKNATCATDSIFKVA